jgi:hypothetical protein
VPAFTSSLYLEIKFAILMHHSAKRRYREVV